jgi:hypothetical protein
MIKLHRLRRQRQHRPERRPAAHTREADTRQADSGPPAVPEDAMRYVCGCGNIFTADVTATVTCPACGGGQAW